jgi:FtsP/CotA-like multicopper oxidase with cupredoxin domain
MNDPKGSEDRLNRRAFLRRGAAVTAGLGLGGAGLSLVGCERNIAKPSPAPARAAESASGASSVREVRLTAAPGEVAVGPGRTYRSWFYDGQYPGPEIRVKEGERLRVTVQNELPEAGTTVHWHGLPVPNEMDGVPGITQEPIPPGGAMTYEFEARPAGTYMYHSHQGLQLDRGLVGPLIIEERTPHVEYDREHTVILDDFLPGAPRPLEQLAAGREGSGCMNRRGPALGRWLRGRRRL